MGAKQELLRRLDELRRDVEAITEGKAMAEPQAGDAGADIDVEVAGQKVNIKNVKSLNTIVTLLSFAVLCVIAYGGWMHAAETKEASSALVGALRDQTQVMRESNCLQTYRGPDDQKGTFCKQVSR